eukprot:4678887-Alexandrium_andersonii.AAC.1
MSRLFRAARALRKATIAHTTASSRHQHHTTARRCDQNHRQKGQHETPQLTARCCSPNHAKRPGRYSMTRKPSTDRIE